MRRILWACIVLLAGSALGLWAAGEAEPMAAATPKTLEVTKVFYFNDVSDYPELKKEFMEQFSAKFGVNLVVNTAPRNTFMEKINLMITSGELKGFVLAFTPGDVLKWKDDGVILPMDEYLKDNPVWKKQPEYVRTAGLYDGQVWSLPSGWADADNYARSYRQDWADKLGIKTPKTVDELYAMAKAFTFNDPDGNGKQDTWGMVSSGTWNLQDLFQAYDARLNNFGADAIVWDPNENAWVDSMLKPEMLDAMRFLNKVYKEGILDPETFTNKGSTMREKIWSGRYGSTFYGLTWGLEQFLPNLQKNVPEATVGIITAMTGKRTKNVNHLVAGGGNWALLKSTPNPKEMANTFVDLFLGDEQACLWGLFGIEGKTFRLDGEKVIQLKDPAANAVYATPGLTVRMPSWPRSKYINYPDGTAEEIAAAAARKARRAGLMDGAAAEGLLYDASGWKDVCLSPTYTAIINDVRKIFDGLIVKIATGEITPEAAVAEYRAQMKVMGGQQMLEEANKKVGLTLPALYKY